MRRPKGRLRQLLIYVLIAGAGAAAGAILSFSLIDVAEQSDIRGGYSLLLLLAILPIFFVCIAIHELGHVIAGLMARFQFYSIQIGPLRLVRTPSGLHFDTNWALALAGGMAVTYPKEMSDLRMRALLYYAGGPAASFDSFLIAGIVFYALNGWPINAANLTTGDLLLLFFGGNSLLIAILTMIPSRTMGITSDGSRIFSILFNHPNATRDLALFALFGLSHSGVRPQDWDEGWLDDALSIQRQDFMSGVSHGFAYAKRIDSGDYAQAREHLQQSINLIDARNLNYRPNLVLEAIYFEAAVREDLERARLWLDEIPPKAVLEAARRNRADAALLALEGKEPLARLRISAARESLDQSLDVGSRIAEHEMLDMIEASLQAP